MQGGLKIALRRPAEAQVYIPDFQRAKGECAPVAYLDESLAF
jgi:hypothetical protein